PGRAGARRGCPPAARRRSALAVGAAAVLVLVFGGAALTTGLFRDPGGAEVAAGSAQDASSPNVTPFSAGEPEMLPKGDVSPDRSGGIPPKSLPEDPSTQGDEPSGSADRTPVGSAQRGCVEVDRELAVALADELPVANAGQASPAAADCPAGARGASFLVRDGDDYGTVSVVITPSGTALSPDRTEAYASAKTAGGDELYVISRSAAAADDPFQDELPAWADRLAARF
ncbi:hypothetical protein AB0G02_00840, partial [Actinosynnema sp. NPDC023658]|uniref:hypothetical protein n=1 Tax=Actinosynnema sp. NPDC023658 TaxID=3155465 RepID=UPI0033E923E9